MPGQSIEVEYCGRLSDVFGARAELALPEGIATVSSLRAHLDSDGQLLHPSIRAVVNNAVVPETHPVRGGDRVAFLPPVGGG